MKTYPTGCIQNHASAGPPDYAPVDPDMWRTFGTQSEADAGLDAILEVTDQAQMFPAELWGGIYAAFKYLKPENTIHSRMCVGRCTDDQGVMHILEYPSDIHDRNQEPKTMIDAYTPGQPHELKVRRLDSVWGQLYWAALE